MFRIVTVCYGSETPPPPPPLRGEFFPMTTPKLASNVWTYVCWETSSKPGCRLQVYLADQELFHQSSWEGGTDLFLVAISKNAENGFRKLYSCFVVVLKFPVECPCTLSSDFRFCILARGVGGGGYSGFQLIGIVKNNSLFKPGKIHQEYKKT